MSQPTIITVETPVSGNHPKCKYLVDAYTGSVRKSNHGGPLPRRGLDTSFCISWKKNDTFLIH